jgi:hypothetical protein
MDLEVYYGPNKKKETFFTINLGGDEMLLGYPFLSNTNPPINWKTSTFYGNVTIATEDAHLWTPERQLKLLKEIKPEMYETEEYNPNFIPSNEQGTILYPKKYLRKMTTATDLAIEARDKKERTWQEIVPKPYHAYGKVFDEIKAMCFPKSRPWDHAIEFTEDVPKTIDCKLIQLALCEQKALDKFLDEHLKKKYITTSNLNYTSPFFFVKKKDGELRPVQDYRAINKYTKRNTYPLPLIKEIIAQIRDADWFTKFDI